MSKPIILLVLAVLSGCSTVVVVHPNTASPCYANEASYECQVERYHNVNAD